MAEADFNCTACGRAIKNEDEVRECQACGEVYCPECFDDTDPLCPACAKDEDEEDDGEGSE